MKNKEAMIASLKAELQLRIPELSENSVETIYFGGGTPSLLEGSEIAGLLNEVFVNYRISKEPEITLEANPDDLDEKKLVELRYAGVNRLSIGIQSFFNEHLQLMNRAHNSKQAIECVKNARATGFDNISIDLIYCIPGMTSEQWKSNIQQAIDLGTEHISCYGLTIEPRTMLSKQVKKGTVLPAPDETFEEHFSMLQEMLEANGFIHYEISNFCKPGLHSRHNTAYWDGRSYIGIGPSAHSFNGNERSWNVSNNQVYIRSLAEKKLVLESESLTEIQKLNEYVLTRLRTVYGLDKIEMLNSFGTLSDKVLAASQIHINSGILIEKANHLFLSKKGKMIADKVSSDLFQN